MSYFLTRRAVLKWLETPSVYQVANDELYELDEESFHYLKNCATEYGCSAKDNAFTDYCVEEGLLSAGKADVHRPALKRAPSPSLRYLELQITDACNLRCSHCYIDKASFSELTVDQVRNALKEFEEMQGLRVLITGGEPLIHSKFAEINEMLPDFFIRKVLFTNGILLTKEKIKSLKVDEIQVSIDGLEKGHDAVRGSGSFRRSMEAIKQSLDAGFAVSVSTMVLRENLTDFDDLERMFKELGIKDWTVDIPTPAGTLREHPELIVTPEEGGKFLGYGYGGGLHAAAEGYGCGYHLMAVFADTRIAKCTFYHDRPIGALQDGLQAAWQKLKPIRLNDLAYGECEYLAICRGGCRYRAEILKGKGAKDPYRCMLYGIL